MAVPSLFPSPTRPKAPIPARLPERPGTFTPYRGKTRIQCADCVLINYQGTPWPVAAARWRRKGDTGERYVCSLHRIAEEDQRR